MANETVFIIDDDARIRDLAERLLAEAEFRASCFADEDLAIDASKVQSPVVIVFEVEEHEDADGRYRRLHQAMPTAKFIVSSDATGVGTTAESLGLVALRKPFDEAALVQVVKNAVDGPLLKRPA